MYIYLIQTTKIEYTEKGIPYIYVKIGVSNNPAKRLNQLQTGNHLPLTLTCEYDTVDAYTKEHFLHLLFNKYKSCSEWFWVKPESVKDIEPIIKAVAEENYNLLKKLILHNKRFNLLDKLPYNPIYKDMYKFMEQRKLKISDPIYLKDRYKSLAKKYIARKELTTSNVHDFINKKWEYYSILSNQDKLEVILPLLR